MKNFNFSITQILREINLREFEIANFAISTYSEALNFDFYDFLPFLKTEIQQFNKIQSP